MKIRTVLLVFTVLSLVFSLFGCAVKAEEPQDPTVDYEARIKELETLLEKEREAKYISDAAYEERIEALQTRLELLANASGDAFLPPEEELLFYYRVENGKAVITGYGGTATLVTVPEVLDGYPVVAIGEHAFSEKAVAAIVLPDGLESIGWFAFYGCEGLTDVSIPASVTSIGYAVFDGCPNVTFICPKDSYAADYAASYGLPYITH